MSIPAALVAIIVFAGGWFAAYAALAIFDQLRGLGDSVVQLIFRELFAPGIAGYLGHRQAEKWVPGSNPQTVFYIFSFVLIAATVAFLTITLPIADRIGETTYSLLLWSLAPVSGIVGAFVYARERL